ncbi:HIT family protein [Streptomyces sp. NRRL B-24720]|uniref:HIT family protein n=1 Tax=Streptomyces sp. NRRL B-24720 TaxID=1476876 RepID=UPI001F22385A|nr:HIT family protein [Streptomyces sp. NRRL B-24720]
MACVFCCLICEDSARWIFRGPTVSAFAPLDPLAPGHALVIPTSHYAAIFDTPPEVLAEAMTLVQRLSRTMRTALKAGGVNILSASGPGSEQSVPHLHFHVVPRWADDGLSTWPTEQSQRRISGDPVIRLASAMAASHAA